MIVKPKLEQLRSTNRIDLEQFLDKRYLVYIILEKYFHSKGVSKPSKKSVNNILDTLPSNKKYNIKKHFIVISNNFEIEILKF